MAVWMFVQIGVYAAVTGVQYYQARQAEKRAVRASERELVDVPYVSEVDVIPVLFGTAWFTGPNVMFIGRQSLFDVDEDWLAADQKTWQYQHWYYSLCHGPVESWSARYGADRLLSNPPIGEPAPSVFNTSETETLLLSERQFLLGRFGVGARLFLHALRVLPGTLSQTATITQAEPGLLTQRFPGLCYAYARYHRVGGDERTGRPPQQAASFRVTRLSQRWQRLGSSPPGTYEQASQWYAGKAAIGDDMNPAHIIREVLTDPVWGMDLGELAPDEASFRSAADTLYAEGFGLSMVWAQESSALEFIQEMLRHIDGLLFVDSVTGKFELQVLRTGSGTLHDLTDPSDHIAPPTYVRPSFRDVANKVTIKYSSPTVGRERSTTIANDALVLSLGEVSSTASYPGIHSDELAAQVAGRDLQRLSTPLARVQITTTWSKGSSIRPADRVSFSWSQYGIASMSLRVLSVGFGEIDDSSVTLDCVEDVYATTAALFGAPGASSWTPPEDTPLAPPRQLAQQLPLAFARYVGIPATSTSTGFWPLFAAESPSDIHVSFNMTINNVQVEPLDRPLTQTRALSADLAAVDGIAEQIVELTSPFSGLVVGRRYLAALGAEILELRYTGSDTRVWRGRYDTVPFYASSTLAYMAGTRVFLLGQIGSDQAITPAFAFHQLERSATVLCRALTKTSTQILPTASSVSTSITNLVSNRAIRPYNMGHLQTTMGPAGATFAWRRRNRLTQPDAFQNSTTVTPEIGTVHRIRIEYLDGSTWTIVPSMSVTGYVELAIGTTSYTYTAAVEEDDVIASAYPTLLKTFDNIRAQCYTARDGYESWQRHFRYRT